jgi:NADH dehydrogenase (ubiquinone) 1 alpha subcomplex subunit 2
MKKNNPSIPIMLREAQGTLPKIYARYGPSSSIAGAGMELLADGLDRVRKGDERVIRR